MTKYEITNPSDPWFIRAERFEDACVATVLIGQGAYGLRADRADDAARTPVMPIFLFGGHDEWFKKTFEADLDAVITRMDRAAVATVLESIHLPEGRARSSMNNIGAFAARMAARLREPAAEATKTEPAGAAAPRP